MATTTTMNQPQPTTRASNKAIYWGFAIALIVVLGIAFAARTPRVNDTVVPVTTTEATTTHSNMAAGTAATTTTTNREAMPTTKGATANSTDTTTIPDAADKNNPVPAQTVPRQTQ